VAGTNQHYIPQSLLRAFGKQGKGKEVQVAVYTRQKNFVTSTRGAAAQRYFYSELSADSTRTLDDRITEEYEPRINFILAQLHQQAIATPVDAAQAAELIAHLCVRTAQMRESFTHGTSQLLSGAIELFNEPDTRWKLMGLDNPEPSGVVLEELNKLYDQMNLGSMGIPRPLFLKRGYEEMKAQIRKNSVIMAPIMEHAKTLTKGLAGVAAAGQKRALAEEAAPEQRIAALATLSWSLQDFGDDLILPDCVAVDGSTREDCRAFVYRANEELRHVLMPVSRRRLLVGSRGIPSEVTAGLANLMFAVCSWQFFIAHDRAPASDALALLIGSATKTWFDAEISAALASQLSSR